MPPKVYLSGYVADNGIAPNQGLPGRITPQQAWDVTEVAQAPRPDHDTAPITPGGPDRQQHTTARRRVHRHKPIGATGERELTISRNGTVHIGEILFLVNRHLASSTVIAIWDTSTITFADSHGEVLIQHTWPPQGTTYVSHHPLRPTNQRGGHGREKPQPSPTSRDITARLRGLLPAQTPPGQNTLSQAILALTYRHILTSHTTILNDSLYIP